ncbi:hypothetical protein DBV15_01901 [Temnothorax longispinosus]|uniref:THAP-type domain-containing protein n=1 Tax=Temnothorax longispinosus TaxID=300112 RepID=A0A4S2KXL4_9HYME|nr:hypothetical protein DBV15_01901 [Temnothorax longispinosus]
MLSGGLKPRGKSLSVIKSRKFWSQCCADGCFSRQVKGKVFHLLPSGKSDSVRRAEWIRRIGRECWTPNRNTRLCEDHFTPDQYEQHRIDGKRKLKCNAVPSIFMRYIDVKSHQLTANRNSLIDNMGMSNGKRFTCLVHISRPVGMTERGGYRCAFKGCRSASNDKRGIKETLFRFPKDAERSKLWVSACGREELTSKTAIQLYKDYRVCKLHFANYMFLNYEKTRLQPHAVPSYIVKNNDKKASSSSSNVETRCINTSKIKNTQEENTALDLTVSNNMDLDVLIDRTIANVSDVPGTQTPLSLSSISVRKGTIRVHHFPKSDELLKKWSLVIGTDKKITGSSQICSRHFKEEDFRYSLVGGKRYLKKEAIPSLHLNKETKDETVWTVSNNQGTIIKENQSTNTAVIEYSERAPENKVSKIVELHIKAVRDDKLSERRCKQRLWDLN